MLLPLPLERSSRCRVVTPTFSPHAAMFRSRRFASSLTVLLYGQISVINVVGQGAPAEEVVGFECIT